MLQGTERDLKETNERLSQAYLRVFDKNSPFVQIVLDDLAQFCRATESTFRPDPREHALLEGRREVILRIFERLELSFEQIYNHHLIHRTHTSRSSR